MMWGRCGEEETVGSTDLMKTVTMCAGVCIPELYTFVLF